MLLHAIQYLQYLAASILCIHFTSRMWRRLLVRPDYLQAPTSTLSTTLSTPLSTPLSTTTTAHDQNNHVSITSPLLKTSQFNVLSFNIFLRPYGISNKNNHGDWKSQRVMDFIPLISQYDIICLQEAFSTLSLRPNHIVDAAKAAGYYFAISKPLRWCSTKLIDSGLLTLSKFPIITTEFLEFTASCSVDGILEKGVMYMKLQITPHLHVHLFNTHIQSCYSTKDSVADQVKLLQAKEVARFVAAKSADGYPVILAGDFNVDCHNPLHSIPHVQTHAAHGPFSHISHHGHSHGHSYSHSHQPSSPTPTSTNLSSTCNEETLYESVMSIFNEWRPTFDLLAHYSYKSGHSIRPTTNLTTYDQHGEEQTANLSAEEKEERKWKTHERSVDYILFCPQHHHDHQFHSVSSKQAQVTIVPQRAVVEPFSMPNRQYSHLSDHFGVVTTFLVVDHEDADQDGRASSVL